MRTVYVLRESEEDGAVLDALAARGIFPDDDWIENPTCPLCGADTLLAYTKGGAHEVLISDCLESEDEGANAEAWYLLCCDFACEYEEQVERVLDPMDATLFDLQISSRSFDEYSGIFDRGPADMRELIKYLRSLMGEGPSRKLDFFLAEARWRFSEVLQNVRESLGKLHNGQKVTFDLEDKELEGTFLASTDQGFLVLTEPEGEMLAISLKAINFVQPVESKSAADTLRSVDTSRFIMIVGSSQMVVIRGHHLRLSMVDRLGHYHAGTRDAASAHALGLDKAGENFWQGRFRRSDVEARYDVRHMIKVQGHWVQVYGRAAKDNSPAVKTDDPHIAAELGLEPVRAWRREDSEPEAPIAHWSGVVSPGQIEEEKEVRVYYWPIPEQKTPGNSG